MVSPHHQGRSRCNLKSAATTPTYWINLHPKFLMLLVSDFTKFQIALAIIWAFPYLALALVTRDWWGWVRSLSGSVCSFVLFTLAYIFLLFLFADYGARIYLSSTQA